MADTMERNSRLMRGQDVSVRHKPRLQAYLSLPPTIGPAVVVCHAYWGVTPHLRRLCDRLATEGFVAIAPSLYGGRSSDDPAIANRLEEGLNDDRVDEDLAATLDHVRGLSRALGKPVGSVGFSMGGWASMRLAYLRPELAAAAAFYGFAISSDFENTQAAFQLHFAGENDLSTEQEQAVVAKIVASGKQVEVYAYPGSRHGFFNEDHPEDHDPASAELAWSRLVRFLSRRLGAVD